MTMQTIGVIGVFTALLWLPTIAVIAAYLFRRLQAQERLKAIEKGIELAFDPDASAAASRRSGIVFTAAGVGIALADVIVAWVARDSEALVGLALAVVPIAVGFGLLLDYRLQRAQARGRSSADLHRS
jgi:uncharacterized membrane protein